MFPCTISTHSTSLMDLKDLMPTLLN